MQPLTDACREFHDAVLDISGQEMRNWRALLQEKCERFRQALREQEEGEVVDVWYVLYRKSNRFTGWTSVDVAKERAGEDGYIIHVRIPKPAVLRGEVVK